MFNVYWPILTPKDYLEISLWILGLITLVVLILKKPKRNP